MIKFGPKYNRVLNVITFGPKCNNYTFLFFFISIAQWSVEEDDTIMRKVAKGEGKTRDKNGKTANVLRSKTTNRHAAFKITFRRDI